MTIKDSLTHESLVRDNHPILPDDGLDHTLCHIDRLHASARARTKHLINLRLNHKNRRGNYVYEF